MKRKLKSRHKIIDFFIAILILGIISFAMIVEYIEKEISKKQNKYVSQKVSYNNINSIYNQEENNQNEYKINYNQVYANEVKNSQSNFTENTYNKTNLEEVNFNQKDIQKNKVEEKYKGYEVSAKLIIPKIELETYVLKNFSLDALNISVTKFWGPDANEIRKLLCSRT